MEQYSISIITICYNSKDELEKTIKSIKAQTYNRIEYIIVDGGSTDGTKDVINLYSDIISKSISEPDKGIYDAMNKGIGLASGDWILFMNAGDVFYSNEVIKKIFENTFRPDTAIVYGDIEQDYGKAGKLIKSLHKFDSKDVALQICHQGMMTRTSILKKIKYDTSYKIMADVDSFKKIHDMGYGFEYVPVVFAVFEVTGGISSTKPILLMKELNRIKGIKKYSLVWWKSYVKALCTSILLNILPKELYDRLRYKKVSSNRLFLPDYREV